MTVRIPRRIKKALVHTNPRQMHRWKLVRRHWLRLGYAAIVRLPPRRAQVITLL